MKFRNESRVENGSEWRRKYPSRYLWDIISGLVIESFGPKPHWSKWPPANAINQPMGMILISYNHSKSLGRTGQFLVTSFGILFFFIVYGYLQGQGSPDFGHRMTVIIKVRSASLDSPKIPWKKNYFHMVILNRIFGNWHFYNFFIIPSALLLRQNYFKNQETVNPNFHNTSAGLKLDYPITLSDWSARRSLRAPSTRGPLVIFTLKTRLGQNVWHNPLVNRFQ